MPSSRRPASTTGTSSFAAGARLGRGRGAAVRASTRRAPRRSARSTSAGTRPCPAHRRLCRDPRRLAAAGVALYAITNYSGDKWAETLPRFPFLGTAFRDTVVSGTRGGEADPASPAPASTERARAAGLRLHRRQRGERRRAAALGIDAIRFTTPEALRDGLVAAGLLPRQRKAPDEAEAAVAPSEKRQIARSAPAPRAAAPA